MGSAGHRAPSQRSGGAAMREPRWTCRQAQRWSRSGKGTDESAESAQSADKFGTCFLSKPSAETVVPHSYPSKCGVTIRSGRAWRSNSSAVR